MKKKSMDTTDKQTPHDVTYEQFAEMLYPEDRLSSIQEVFNTVVAPLQKELSEARGRIERLEAGWVSVKEGLPEKGEGVQCFFKYEQRLNIDSPSGKSITVGMINEHGSWVTQSKLHDSNKGDSRHPLEGITRTAQVMTTKTRVTQKYSPTERFHMQVDKSDKCWNWTGRKAWNGYGRIRYNGHRIAAHL